MITIAKAENGKLEKKQVSARRKAAQILANAVEAVVEDPATFGDEFDGMTHSEMMAVYYMIERLSDTFITNMISIAEGER